MGGRFNGSRSRPTVPNVPPDRSALHRSEETGYPGVHLNRPTVERLYDLSPEPVVLVDAEDGHLRYCNQTFMDLCGLRPKAVRRRLTKGVKIGEVLRLENGAALDQLVQRAAQLGQPLGDSSIRGDASRGALYLTVTAAPIDVFEGGGPVVVVTFRNTTAEHRVQSKYQSLLAAARRHAEELESKVRQRTLELTKAQEDLLHASRLAAVGEVAGAAAHEVFNPLTAVSANLDSMRSGIRDERDSVADLRAVVTQLLEADRAGGVSAVADRLGVRTDGETDIEALEALTVELEGDLERRERTLSMVCNACRRIERIVQGMLGMAGGQAEPEVLAIDHLFREARDLMTYSFDRAGVALTMRPLPGTRVYADRGELLQVLTNLLRNGCQAAHAAHGSKGGSVTATAGAQAQMVEIRVEDNGVGVPENAKIKIFESGFTTKRRGEGTGLGLPIARRLMRRNGGDLVLESSTSENGTTMLITLPSSAPDLSGGRHER